MSGRRSRGLLAALLLAGLAAGALLALLALDRAFPPDLTRLADLSPTVTDRDGRVLAAFLNDADAWRQPAGMADAPRHFVDLLLAYEDRRFFSHMGVDPAAAARATLQNLAAGRVVSGASTLTMQTARLLEPRPRSLSAKLRQAVRALQLEWRYDKPAILAMYLTLAPYGGNVEGLRAAAWSWFGKRADALTPGEAALLVALPRAPSLLRPDRAPVEALRQARAAVIERAVAAGALSRALADEALAEPLPAARRPFPAMAIHAARRLAIHAARRLAATSTVQSTIRSTLDGGLQGATERLLREALAEEGPHASMAALVVENRSRQVRAYVGAADPADPARQGAVDMVRALRSPGSALKPFVYGLGFSLGLLHPESRVADVSTRFGDYAPQNFDRGFHGDLTIREALQRSLNVPAVLALQKIGPQRFARTLTEAGAHLVLPAGETAPGLPLALGGVGVSLWDLTGLYVALAGEGAARPLILRDDDPAAGVGEATTGPATALLSPEAARAALRILEGTPTPEGLSYGAERRGQSVVALKTGTSFGFRDAWAFGVSADYTVGVWVGRPDGTPSPGRYGAVAAAPLVYRIFDLLPPSPGRPSGAGGALTADGAAPAMLRRITAGGRAGAAARDPLRLLFPTPGARIELDGDRPVVLEARGGRRPLTWLVDGQRLGGASALTRNALWRPAGPGAARVTVLDADGAAASAEISLQ